jgi:hypothetical protein
MMTKQQYIGYWINTASDDWETVNQLDAINSIKLCLLEMLQ